MRSSVFPFCLQAMSSSSLNVAQRLCSGNVKLGYVCEIRCNIEGNMRKLWLICESIAKGNVVLKVAVPMRYLLQMPQ